MLEATKDSIRLLSEATSEAIVDNLILTRSVLEELYKSGVGGFSEEEIQEDVALSWEFSQRLEAAKGNEEILIEYLYDKQLFLSKIRKKYNDFLPNRMSKLFRLLEEECEVYVKLANIMKLLPSSASEKNDSETLSLVYAGLVSLSEFVEKYATHFSRIEQLNHSIETCASVILAASTLALKLHDSYQSEEVAGDRLQNEEIVSNLTAIKNTARGILWQLDQAEKERKFPVGDLLNWLDTSPGWAGDDFDECLDYVNRTRK